MDEITIYAQTQPQVEKGPQGQWVITFKGSYALHQRTVERPPVQDHVPAPVLAPAAEPPEREPRPRMRTLPKAAEELKEKDPNTGLTYGTLRRWVKEGRIKSFDGGKCKLVDLDELERLVYGG